MSEKTFEEWAILELMGHRRLAGKISEYTIGGASFIRIDVPGAATQFYTPAAIYCITPIAEDMARRFAENNKPAPIQQYELPPVVGHGVNYAATNPEVPGADAFGIFVEDDEYHDDVTEGEE